MHQPDDPPHPEADNPPDDQPARWMTFAELAKSRGISKLSAAALVRRHGWRRQRDNRGHVIALVPNDGPELRRAIPSEPDYPADDQADHPAHIAAFETALTAIEAAHASEVAALQVQLDTSEQSARALADQLADAHTRADAEIATLRDMVGGVRDTVGRAETRAVSAERRVIEAEARAAQVEADATEHAETLRRPPSTN